MPMLSSAMMMPLVCSSSMSQVVLLDTSTPGLDRRTVLRGPRAERYTSVAFSADASVRMLHGRIHIHTACQGTAERSPQALGRLCSWSDVHMPG